MTTSMKYSFLFTNLFLLIFSCSPFHSKNNEGDNKGLHVDTSIIAIIPFKESSSINEHGRKPAVLTNDDLEKIERLLRNCVSNYNGLLPADSKKAFLIDLDNVKYKRQYVAYTNSKGEKEVWINCMCHTYGDDWKTTVYSTSDGGNCFFCLTINLVNENCYQLIVNGLA